MLYTHTRTTVLRPFFRDHQGELVPQEKFWTLWCKGRLTEAQTIRLGATPSGISSAHLHHPHFLQAGCPSCHPTNSVKSLKAIIMVALWNRADHYTVSQKKGCHPNHDSNFVNSWWICKILSLLERPVNFQQNQ